MAIEAELKARVHDPEGVTAALEEAHGPGRAEVYRDTYYDDPAGSLTDTDRELRIRTVYGNGSTRTVLTYKGARVDGGSGSKPESETRVDGPDAAHAILRGLGYLPRIAFEKHCRNYGFAVDGHQVLATLVRVPEIDGTYLEVETPTPDEASLPAALAVVRGVLRGLGITDRDLTTELYTEAVAAAHT
ncbi:class IV adenylate cyclase [Kitasatospora sp. NRRL B-11411]|uniref:class IV adenylate cyclase n=1 Tax=Kitasatospora sp. NRRL B-11411 TaxID=1463822 RepID=UPI0004C3D648|nr:class IV adenylate cyclase [Kitasatospora sp. NRRL B-11411]